MPTSATSSSGVSPLLPLNTAPSHSYKEQLRRFLHLSFYQLGLSSLYAHLQREAIATILMYHSVPTLDDSRWIDPYNSLSAEDFERQMQFLARHRHVISIEALVEKLRRRETLERGTVVITFDDGYRDNLTVAAPILAKYNLPATIYLATGYVDSGQNQWADTLYAAFRARSRSLLTLSGWHNSHPDDSHPDDSHPDNPSLSYPFQDWDLADRQQLNQAHTALVMYLIQADIDQRDALLAEIDAQLAPVAYPPRLTINWAEVTALKAKYPNITLGIHTSNHLDLSTHSDKAAEEMTASIQHMQAALGLTPKHLAFPYNRYCEQAQTQVKAAQLSSAVVATLDPVVRADTCPYALPRLEAPKSMLLLKSWTNGGFPDVSGKLFRQPWMSPY